MSHIDLLPLIIQTLCSLSFSTKFSGRVERPAIVPAIVPWHHRRGHYRPDGTAGWIVQRLCLAIVPWHYRPKCTESRGRLAIVTAIVPGALSPAWPVSPIDSTIVELWLTADKNCSSGAGSKQV
ncbi:hypothetical protein L6452_02573 [Arctium lappa]|uniref:Uncharacterized protein n=1 Tax=Arctium lappa TaxID=4217 RepID=A0ACB9FJY2_ARCLA|nr:hypothetical protein L6452_02573 [Arctium lappa]